MAIKFTTVRWVECLNDYYREFICDTDEDLENLPKSGTGSVAVSLESGRAMVVNTNNEWVEIGG